MAKQRSETFLNGLEGGTTASFMDEEFTRLERCMERRGHAAAPTTAVPATAVPIGEAPARPTGMGMFMPSTMPELRGREDFGMFLKSCKLGHV